MENKNLDTSPKVINTEQQMQQPIQRKTESRPPIKMNWKLIAVLIIIGVLLGVILLWHYVPRYTFWDPHEAQIIEQQKREQERKIKELNKHIIDTSSWQTYRNEEFGFEVRYPEDLQVSVGSADGKIFIAKNSVNEILPKSYIEIIDFARAKIDDNPKKLSLDAWMNKFAVGRNVRGIVQNASLGTREIYRAEGKSGKLIFSDNYLMNEQGKVFELSLNARDEKEIELFDQILATFRFIK